MRVAALNISGMPKGDAEALQWLQNFAQGLASSPELWPEICATQQTSDRITVLVKVFEQVMIIAGAPDSNSSHVRAKTVARNNAVLAVRAAINAARANPAITSAHLARLNLPTMRDELERDRIEARRVRHRLRAV